MSSYIPEEREQSLVGYSFMDSRHSHDQDCFRDWLSPLVRMVLTMNTWLPSEEELTVEEVKQ